MAILVTSKYEEDPIKIEGASVATTQDIDFSNTQVQITLQSEVGSGRNSNSFRDVMDVLVTLKNKKDPNKTEGHNTKYRY